MCRGWEVANEFGSSVIALSKQISDDEDVFISFKADMQSDISVPEDVGFCPPIHGVEGLQRCRAAVQGVPERGHAQQ